MAQITFDKNSDPHEILDALLVASQNMEQAESNEERYRIALNVGHCFRLLNANFHWRQYDMFDSFQNVMGKGKDEDCETRRETIATMLKEELPITGETATQLIQGLLALNEGEVQPIFKRSAKGKTAPAWTKSYFQLLAVIHVFILRGSGLSAQDARQRVAKAFGCGEYGEYETIRSWETRLKDSFDDHFIQGWKNIALEIGKRGVPLDGNIGSTMQWFEDQGGTIQDPEFERTDTMINWLTPLAILIGRYDLETSGKLYQRALRHKDVEVPDWLGLQMPPSGVAD